MKSLVKSLSYRAIDRGLRLPEVHQLASYQQLARTIDLIRRQNVSLVLDVGANQGWYAYHLRRAGYRGPIISFEPLAREQAHIQQLAQGDALWTNQCVALGEENGPKTFNMVVAGDEQTVLSSFLNTIDGLGDRTEQVEVQMRRLDSLLPELVSDFAKQRIFLKMDTQGYDLSVFSGAAGIADQVVLLQSEISVEPIYVGMPPYTESLAHYHEAGFKLCDLFVVHRLENGNVLEYDCLMERAGA